jgi:hypothetical protein
MILNSSAKRHNFCAKVKQYRSALFICFAQDHLCKISFTNFFAQDRLYLFAELFGCLCRKTKLNLYKYKEVEGRLDRQQQSQRL